MKLYDTKTLADLFTLGIRPDIELAELAARGIEYQPKIGEIKLIPIWSVGFLTLTAAAQITGGIYATWIGASPIGMSLMGEGASDLLNLYTACTTGDFSLGGWAAMKAVSGMTLGVSMYG